MTRQQFITLLRSKGMNYAADNLPIGSHDYSVRYSKYYHDIMRVFFFHGTFPGFEFWNYISDKLKPQTFRRYNLC